MARTTARPSGDRLLRLREPAGILAVNGLAMTAVLVHVLIDFHIGLYGGSSDVMTLAQAANAVRIAVTAGGWMIALGVAMGGSRTGTACALAFVSIWGLLVNGIVAFLVVPPPSAAFPFQDVAHVGGIVFGGFASYLLWHRLRHQEGPIRRRYVGLALAWLLLVGPALGVGVWIS